MTRCAALLTILTTLAVPAAEMKPTPDVGAGPNHRPGAPFHLEPLHQRRRGRRAGEDQVAALPEPGAHIFHDQIQTRHQQ